MSALADWLVRQAPAWLDAHPLTPAQRRALLAITRCRTPALGGHLWYCAPCDKQVYVYHGCRNRACPACHGAQTQQWLADRHEELLPCPYFHLTATVPEGLRDLFRKCRIGGREIGLDLLQDALLVLGKRHHISFMKAT